MKSLDGRNEDLLVACTGLSPLKESVDPPWCMGEQELSMNLMQ